MLRTCSMPVQNNSLLIMNAIKYQSGTLESTYLIIQTYVLVNYEGQLDDDIN